MKQVQHPLCLKHTESQGFTVFLPRTIFYFIRMHLHNEELRKREQKKESSVHKVDAEGTSGSYVDKFGFHVTTCCGFIPQDNSWTDDWPVG